ncbi:MAG TPA: patatin-like phospholipase family protein [Solirubrobacterales bacterium]|jgi:NTE family protein|nr:patatin-like phospholipase family protein [Solirubrobacterales bacterium]
MNASTKQADLVLEGGGVKGVGLVGAVLRLMQAGYVFPRIAGTSAGAVVASFLASGASADRLRQVMDRLEYPKVPDRAAPPIPGVSEGISLLRHAGAYEGDYIHEFLRKELSALGVTTFGDLRSDDAGADPGLDRYRRYKLVVMATDITNGRLLRLPWDYELLGLDPDRQSVADAVRASISIPLYFEPVKVRHGTTGREVTLVDGGVLSNFPIEAFDRTDGAAPRWPTFGVRILPDLPEGDAQLFPGAALPQLPPIHLMEQVTATAIAGHDQTYLERPCVRRRSMLVDTGELGIVEFDASAEKRARVLTKGEEAAQQFLDGWDWEAYKRECRVP